VAEGGLMKNQGTLRIALACAALLCALSMVVYRQSRALEALRALDNARNEHTMLESSRATLSREIQQLESRNRIVATAGATLGLHVPSGSEIVILQLPSRADEQREDRSRAAARVAMEAR
jgi:cell division protein FtsL